MKLYFTVIALLVVSMAKGQWTTNGANIYNSNTGNVGIGTAGPGYKLDLISSSANTNRNSIISSDVMIAIGNSNTTANNLSSLYFLDASRFGVASVLAQIKDHTTHTATLSFQTRKNAASQPGTQMLIDENGNVGVGTLVPAYKFQVGSSNVPTVAIGENGLDTGGKSSLLFFAGANGVSNGFSLNYLKTSATDRFGIYDGYAQERFTLANGGNVGIGTTTPTSRLHIAGGGGYNLDLNVNGRIVTGDATNAGGIFLDGVTNKQLVGQLTPTPTSMGLYNNGWRMVLDNAGNVGIANLAPAQALHVNGSFRLQGPNGTTMHGLMEFYRNDGTKFASIGQANLGLANSTFDIQHFSGNDIRFLNNTVEQMRITASGKIGIGTANPDQKLTVNGMVHATSVKVETTVPGPDYVFEESYALPTLDEVKSYIEENKHLPEVPSASEMEKNGINVGEMNMLLLKKVEELTLYMIEMKKENAELKNRIEKIEQEKK